jgi:hypothetical protein
MSLSDFGYDILVILDDAEDPLLVEEIANRLSNERHGRISTGVTGIHLEHALDKYVERKEEGKWGIASPHHGKFSPTKQPASEAEENVERKEAEKEALDELGQLIVRLLADSDEPMLAKEIAAEISESTHGISTTDVNRRLYNSLSSLVEKDPKHQWGLVNKDYEESPEDETGEAEKTSRSNHTEDRNGVPGRSPKAEVTEELAQDNSDGSSPDTEEESAGMDQPVTFAPSGRAGEIGARLETAKQIALFLDLSPQPLHTDRLTELFEACGREVTENTVRQCLKTTLDPFVRREDGGYCLKDEKGDAVGASTDESSREERTGKSEDSGDTPIDAATRASVAGRRYDYVFENRELDSPALFASQIRGGTVEITINAAHFAFDSFQHVLNGETDSTESTAEHQLHELLRLLIVAWTEVEGDLTDRRKELAEEIRDDWGRALRFLLRERNEQ